MRITICISSLGRGGAERIATIMADHWVKRGDSVSIVTLAEEETVPSYPLDGRVSLHNLGLTGASSGVIGKVAANLRRVARLRSTLRRLEPDVVISFMDSTNVLVQLASLGLSFPVIVTEHCHPVQFPLGKGWAQLRKALYPRAASVVVLGTEIREWFARHLGLHNLEIVHNPVMVNPDLAGTASGGSNVVISAGRLAEEKQFGRLIEAFVPLAEKFPEWQLVVYGEGPDRPDLEAQIAAAGLDGRVVLPGWVDDLHDRLAAADLFVMSSRSEAFPGALCEAMACGLPVVSFDCPSGPAEIIRPGVDGELVPPDDVPALSDAMDKLMRDSDLRRQYGARGVEVLDRFSLERIMAKWDALIRTALGRGA